MVVSKVIEKMSDERSRQSFLNSSIKSRVVVKERIPPCMFKAAESNLNVMRVVLKQKGYLVGMLVK